MLCYKICDGTLQLDPERLRPLLQMPPSSDSKSLKRCLGMFAYYAKWISNYSFKNSSTQFPMPPMVVTSFEGLKKDIAESSVKVIDDELPFFY